VFGDTRVEDETFGRSAPFLFGSSGIWSDEPKIGFSFRMEGITQWDTLLFSRYVIQSNYIAKTIDLQFGIGVELDLDWS
jgi:hypothetical protein